MTVVYEWDCETVADGDSPEHEDGECIEHRHGESFAEVSAFAKTPAEKGTKHILVLVRDDYDGRSWAYVEDSKIDPYFYDANGQPVAKVPQRFVKEVEKG